MARTIWDALLKCMDTRPCTSPVTWPFSRIEQANVEQLMESISPPCLMTIIRRLRPPAVRRSCLSDYAQTLCLHHRLGRRRLLRDRDSRGRVEDGDRRVRSELRCLGLPRFLTYVSCHHDFPTASFADSLCLGPRSTSQRRLGPAANMQGDQSGNVLPFVRYRAYK